MSRPDPALVLTVLKEAADVAQHIGLETYASKLVRFHKRFQTEAPSYKSLRDDVEPVRNELEIRARELLLDEWRKPRPGMEKSVRDYNAAAKAMCDLIYPPEPQSPEMNIAKFAGAKYVEEKMVRYEGDKAGVRPVVEQTIALVRDYAKAVGSGDFEAAYEMTDSGLRAWMNFKRFVGEHERGAKEWGGPPLEYHIERLVYVYTDADARKKSDTRLEGWPKKTPKENRRAQVVGFWIRDRKAQTGCGGSLWVAEEGGKYRVAKFDFYRP
jgi:hypothetical protein